MQPIIVTAHGCQYELIRFDEPLPQPGPACTEPLPEDKREIEVETEHKCQQLREEQLQEAKDRAGNFIEKLGATCNELWNAIDKSITSAVDSAENALHEQCEDNAYARLKKNFPQFITEHLLGDYRCKLCTRGGVLPGHLQVTGQHAMFIPDDGNQFSICVCDILCIQTFQFVENRHCVSVVPAKEADGLQLFLTSGQLLIFKEFLDLALPLRGRVGKPVVEAFDVIDHAWRSSTAVPNPNFRFMDARDFVQPDITVNPVKPHLPQQQHQEPARVPTNLEQRPVNALETHS